MPSKKYRPIQEVQRRGSVSKSAIERAVRRLADLSRSDPGTYREKLRSGSGKTVHLVTKHG